MTDELLDACALWTHLNGAWRRIPRAHMALLMELVPFDIADLVRDRLDEETFAQSLRALVYAHACMADHPQTERYRVLHAQVAAEFAAAIAIRYERAYESRAWDALDQALADSQGSPDEYFNDDARQRAREAKA